MTGAAIPPAVVADAAAAARAWLRAADGDDPDAIAALAMSAILLAEAFCGWALIARGWHEAVAADGTWRALTARPVAAISAVTDAAGVALAAGSYAIDIDAAGVGWVRTTAPVVSAVGTATLVAVDYTAGEAAGWAAVPPPIAQGVAMLVAHLFDDRAGGGAPPAAVAALWRPWRRLRLGVERRA